MNMSQDKKNYPRKLRCTVPITDVFVLSNNLRNISERVKFQNIFVYIYIYFFFLFYLFTYVLSFIVVVRVENSKMIIGWRHVLLCKSLNRNLRKIFKSFGYRIYLKLTLNYARTANHEQRINKFAIINSFIVILVIYFFFLITMRIMII